jgi:hypothetical protein
MMGRIVQESACQHRLSGSFQRTGGRVPKIVENLKCKAVWRRYGMTVHPRGVDPAAAFAYRATVIF